MFDDACLRLEGVERRYEASLAEVDELMNDRVAVEMAFDTPVPPDLGVGAGLGEPRRDRVRVTIDGHTVAVPVVTVEGTGREIVVVVARSRLAAAIASPRAGEAVGG